MSVCVPSMAVQAVVLHERYPDGVRDTLACGHVVYSSSLVEHAQRRCPCCVRSRKPQRRSRSPRGGRPPTTHPAPREEEAWRQND